MLDKIINIEISASTVAWYGAILATVSIAFEGYRFWVNRSRLRICIKKDQEIWGEDENRKLVNLEPKEEFWTFSIANVGGQKVVIFQIGINWNYKKGGAIITKDYFGPVKRIELQPFESTSLTISNNLLTQDRIKEVWVKDAIGKIYIKKF